MYDIFYVGEKIESNFQNLKNRFINLKQVDNVFSAAKKAKTKFYWIVWNDIVIEETFDFTYKPDEWSQDVSHVFKNGLNYDGIWLLPKNKKISEKEIEYRFLVSRKEVDILASYNQKYDYFEVDSYEDYLHALNNTKTTMFWASSCNISVNQDLIHNFHKTTTKEIVKSENHVFKHIVDDKEFYNGLFLLSKRKVLTKNEIEYRHLVSRIEWNVVGSGPTDYDTFEIDSYEQYLQACKNAKTELFYATSKQIIQNKKLNLYFTHDDVYNRKENHVFLNVCNDEQKENGVFLLSKHKILTKKEIEYRHIVYKKSWNIIASKHKPYDVVFISYNESNADEHYEKLIEKAPHATRVHGVKGIHQAHIQAAKQSQSEMVWIVDADAILMDDFNFDLYIEKWDRETVHVWRSKNPINDLVYGYGGIKLFPRQLTIDMDTSKPDMTTSITNKFKAMPNISNITAFNTDPFNTWKSAFRECCKLASKVINRQKSKETEERLDIWCTVGADKEFGEYAIEGALAGREYGYKNKDDVEALKKINNFEWLKEQYEKHTMAR